MRLAPLLRQRAWPIGCHTPPWPLPRHLQLVQPPEAVYPIRAHHMAMARQKDLDAPIAISRMLRC